MFARRVSIYVKPDNVPGFRQKIDEQAIPLQRKQRGFLCAFTFLCPNRKEVHSISLWETADDAETYGQTAYPEEIEILAPLVDVLGGVTRVQTYEVLNTTLLIASAAPGMASAAPGMTQNGL